MMIQIECQHDDDVFNTDILSSILTIHVKHKKESMHILIKSEHYHCNATKQKQEFKLQLIPHHNQTNRSQLSTLHDVCTDIKWEKEEAKGYWCVLVEAKE